MDGVSHIRRKLRRARLTRDEVGRVMSAADQDLMAYLRRAVDPTETLLAIMGMSEKSDARSTTADALFDHSGKRISDIDAASIIMVRIAAREVSRSLVDARDLLRRGENGEAMRRTRASLNLALRLVNDAESTKVAVRAVVLAALALDVDLVRDLVRNLAYAFDSDLTRELGDLDLKRARDLAHAFDLPLPAAEDRDTFTQAVAVAIEIAGSLAVRLVNELDGIEVDASQADLSGIKLRDIDALASVTWTSFTVWPQGITEQAVRRFSEEISPGMFRVHERIAQSERRLLLI